MKGDKNKMSIEFNFRDYHLSINLEWIKIWNKKDGYRSWTILYSDGHTWNKQGKWMNLWRWPSFYHCSVKSRIEQIILPNGSTKPQMEFKCNAKKGYYKNKDNFWVDEEGNLITGSFQCFDEEIKSVEKK